MFDESSQTSNGVHCFHVKMNAVDTSSHTFCVDPIRKKFIFVSKWNNLCLLMNILWRVCYPQTDESVKERLSIGECSQSSHKWTGIIRKDLDCCLDDCSTRHTQLRGGIRCAVYSSIVRRTKKEPEENSQLSFQGIVEVHSLQNASPLEESLLSMSTHTVNKSWMWECLITRLIGTAVISIGIPESRLDIEK